VDQWKEYLKKNLGLIYYEDINVPAKLLEVYPHEGVILFTGEDHLKYVATYSYKLLSFSGIRTCITRLDSWECLNALLNMTDDLLIITNLDPTLFKDSDIIRLLNLSIKYDIFEGRAFRAISFS